MNRRFIPYLLFLPGSLVMWKPILAEEHSPLLGINQLRGVSILTDALDPSPRKWYVPQELFREYQWRQWETTNYAKNLYRSYMPMGIQYEGDYFYDIFGSFITRGWLWFDWRHTTPRQFGSSLLGSVVPRIAGDSKGGYYYSIGSGGWTVLTPLTFFKPGFRGLQMDFASDRSDWISGEGSYPTTGNLFPYIDPS